MAKSREQKEDFVTQYVDWLNRSQAFFLTEFSGLTMKDIDRLRAQAREVGGEFHIVKNTLCKVAFAEAGIPVQDDVLEGTTAIAFAFDDPPGVAKAISNFAKESEFVKLKAGYLERQMIDVSTIQALADLPPLPVVRVQLLGVLMAPATKLVRTLAEPARQVAAVIQVYSDQNAAVEAA